MTASEQNIEINRLQKEIEKYIALKQSNIIFDFNTHNDKIVLDVVTVNPRHHQSFLFHSSEGVTKVEALTKMLNYIKDYKDKESSYTIQWALKDKQELHTSYFMANNIMSAIEKCFYGNDPSSMVIFSVVLNPIT